MEVTVGLREVMRRWVTGVAVLTCGNQTVHHGMTVNSFTSISIEPPCVTVTLANTTRTKKLVDETGIFAINLLAEDQQEISDRFAGRIPEDGDRFHNLHIVYGENCLPFIQEAAAHLECKVVHVFEMKDSTLYVGAVMSSRKGEDKPPLVYFNRAYHRIIK